MTPLSRVMAWGDNISAKAKNKEKFIETPKTAQEIRAVTDSLRDSLLQMHAQVNSTASRIGTQKRMKFEKHKLPKCEICDFLLVALPEEEVPSKAPRKMDWLLYSCPDDPKSCLSG